MENRLFIPERRRCRVSDWPSEDVAVVGDSSRRVARPEVRRLEMSPGGSRESSMAEEDEEMEVVGESEAPVRGRGREAGREGVDESEGVSGRGMAESLGVDGALESECWEERLVREGGRSGPMLLDWVRLREEEGEVTEEEEGAKRAA